MNSQLAQVARLAEECYAYIVAIETLQYACHMVDFAPMENAFARKIQILSSMAPLTLVVYGCGSVEATTAYYGLQKLVPATGHLDEGAVKLLAGMAPFPELCANLHAYLHRITRAGKGKHTADTTMQNHSHKHSKHTRTHKEEMLW